MKCTQPESSGLLTGQATGNFAPISCVHEDFIDIDSLRHIKDSVGDFKGNLRFDDFGLKSQSQYVAPDFLERFCQNFSNKGIV